MYRHVIWDFDGTLFDTYPVMASVFQQMLREQGREEPLETILETMKISANTTYVKYGFDSNSISKYKTRKAQDELQTVRPFPDIPQICRFIHEHDGYNYILTHRGSSTFALLQAHELTDVFREVVTAEQSFARKPDPSAIRYLMGKYDLFPAETIMIGDRELDVLAGHRAGIDTCLITERLPKATVATYTIQTFNQLSALLRAKT